MMKKIKEILTGKRPLKDIWHYIVGNIRYKAYYSKHFKWLIREHIFEQISYRIDWMDEECFMQGSCKKCGCETTALQMANKSCDNPCYPSMMNKKQWEQFKKGSTFKDKNGTWIKYLSVASAHRPLLFIETNNRYVPKKIS